MYYLFTPGQREEGPFTEAQVAERIHTRRLGPDSLARGPKEPGWHPLSAFPEFKGPLRQHAEMGAILNAPKRSRLATATLCLGVLSLLGIFLALLAGFRVPAHIAAATQAAQQDRKLAALEAPGRRGLPTKDQLIERQTARLDRPERPERPEHVRPAPALEPKPAEPKEAGPPRPITRPLNAPLNPPPVARPEPPRALILLLVGGSVLGLGAVLATLVCGMLALIRLRRPGSNLFGESLAWTGLACAALSLVTTGLGTWQILSHLPMQEVRRYAAYQGRMQALTQLHRQAIAHGGTYPSAENWCDKLAAAGPTNAVSVLGTRKEGSRFGYNARVEGRRHKEVPRDTVIFFELRKPAWNMAGGPDLIKRPGDLSQRVVVVTADGRARLIPALEVDSLRWDP